MALSFHRRTASLARIGPAHFATFHEAGLLFPTLPSGTKTIRFWIRKPPAAGLNQYLFDNRADNGETAYALTYGIGGCNVYANGVRDYGSSGEIPLVFTNQWVDCVITMTGDMHRPVLLGQREGYVNALDASIADLRVYSGESTLAEIQTAQFGNALIARYDFRTMTDTAITDISGNGHDLVVFGTPGIQHDR